MVMNLLETMKERILIGDGAMGTLLYSHGVDLCFEELNLTHPDQVLHIHQGLYRGRCGYYSNEYVWRQLY